MVCDLGLNLDHVFARWGPVWYGSLADDRNRTGYGDFPLPKPSRPPPCFFCARLKNCVWTCSPARPSNCNVLAGDAVDRALVERTTVFVFEGNGQRSLPAAAHELHPGHLADQPRAPPPGQLPPVLPTAGEAQGELPGGFSFFSWGGRYVFGKLGGGGRGGGGGDVGVKIMFITRWGFPFYGRWGGGGGGCTCFMHTRSLTAIDPYNAGMGHVGFSPTGHTSRAPSAKRREVFGEPRERWVASC